MNNLSFGPIAIGFNILHYSGGQFELKTFKMDTKTFPVILDYFEGINDAELIIGFAHESSTPITNEEVSTEWKHIFSNFNFENCPGGIPNSENGYFLLKAKNYIRLENGITKETLDFVDCKTKVINFNFNLNLPNVFMTKSLKEGPIHNDELTFLN